MDRSGQPRTNSPRKIFNENIKNQPLLPNKYKKIDRNLQKELKEGKRKTGDFSNAKLIQILYPKLHYQNASVLLTRNDLLACVVVCNFWTMSATKSQKAVEGLDSQNKVKSSNDPLGFIVLKTQMPLFLDSQNKLIILGSY